MVGLTVDLGEPSLPTVLEFRPFCCTCLSSGGGARPENCKIRNRYNQRSIFTQYQYMFYILASRNGHDLAAAYARNKA